MKDQPPIRAPRTRSGRSAPALAAALLLVVSSPGLTAQVSDESPGCLVCHEELEFLRQHLPSLEEARKRVVDREELWGSAHGDFSCADCHTGFSTFPHQDPPQVTSRSCSSCHEEQQAVWRRGVHSPTSAEGTGADCKSCHSIHDVATSMTLQEDQNAVDEMNRRCEGCHETSGLPSSDPHSASTPCSGCHGSHEIRQVDDIHSRVGADLQGETCGSCHEDAGEGWARGSHGAAAHADPDAMPMTSEARPQGGGAGEEHRDPPACAACHLAHNTLAIDDPGFARQSSDLCMSCHHEYGDTYLDSYHGQAVTLGSEVSATCVSCHSAHAVFPADDPRSMVHETKLIETCSQCHPAAGASFVGFAPHADHNDRENFPVVFWTYKLMTLLLIGVFTVFGFHTALWLLRLTVLADNPDQGQPEENG